MKKLNPIFASFFSMCIFLISGFIYAGIMDNKDGGGYGFALLIFTIYLLPFVGLLLLVIWGLLKRKWVKDNRTATLIFGTGLMIWSVLTIVHILTL